jgi:hypothetical protein
LICWAVVLRFVRTLKGSTHRRGWAD